MNFLVSGVSIAIGLVLVWFVGRKNGFHRDGLETHWAYIAIIGFALVILPIAIWLDALLFPTV